MLDGIVLGQLIREFSTPTFVYDEDELRSRVGVIRDILGRVSLCYSIKANPFLVPIIADIADHLEVCSPGELEICKRLNVEPAKIIYSGVHKESSDIADAIGYGAGILTAESVRHYDLICDEAKKLGVCVDVLLRMTSGNQFGMSVEDIEAVLSSPCSFVNVIGIHYFAGTGRKQLKKQEKDLLMLGGLLDDLKSRFGTENPMLEYGPGLMFPYFTDDDRSDTCSLLKELSSCLLNLSERFTLSVEMGRFIASSCGYYMTSICDLKSSGSSNWCIVDGGINHVNYLGQVMGMKVPVIRHFNCVDHAKAPFTEVTDAPDAPAYVICGSLCTANDVLVKSLPLSDPKIGDVLVFCNIGAYSVTESMGLFLSRTLPRVVIHSDSQSQMVRDFTDTWQINSPLKTP